MSLKAFKKGLESWCFNSWFSATLYMPLALDLQVEDAC